MSASTDQSLLAELATELRAERTVISDHIVEPSEGPRLSALAVALAPERQFLGGVIESVREGYLLHYGEPRLIDPPDRDLALLAGDYLYARALEALAAAGELEAIRELADLISLSAQIHESHAEADRAAARLWLASVVAIVCGTDAEHQSAKQQLRRSGEAAPLQRWAIRRAERAGASDAVAEVSEAVGFRPTDG